LFSSKLLSFSCSCLDVLPSAEDINDVHHSLLRPQRMCSSLSPEVIQCIEIKM
jgi:hypothetical protein